MSLQSFSHGVEYNRPFCSNCQKLGDFVGNCFALSKYFSCNEKKHVVKKWNKTQSAPATTNSGFYKRAS